MISSKLRYGIVAAILLASAVTPLARWLTAQARIRAATEASGYQAEKSAQLAAENLRLSNLLAQSAATETLSAEQVEELLRLRNEISLLRAATNELRKLRDEIRGLKTSATATLSSPSPRTSADTEAELSAETIDAMKNICRELPAALERFSAEHSDRRAGFSELRKYFPTIRGRRMPGLYTFNFVRDEGPKPGDTLILREEGSRTRADGKEARVYGFLDGSAVEVTPEDGDFEAWEKRHLD